MRAVRTALRAPLMLALGWSCEPQPGTCQGLSYRHTTCPPQEAPGNHQPLALTALVGFNTGERGVPLFSGLDVLGVCLGWVSGVVLQAVAVPPDSKIDVPYRGVGWCAL